MAITVADLKFFQSERMTDEDDGGGQMTATEIVSGNDNQIFDDISDVDRAAGDVSIRKVYAAVTSADTSKYLDAGIAIFKPPEDANVSVALFSTGSFYDERTDLADRLEQTIVRGSRWLGYLWGQHLVGMRAITLWQRPEVELPPQGGRLELVQVEDEIEGENQFLWVTGVTDTIRTLVDDRGTFQVREVVLELSEPLEYNFKGTEANRFDLAYLETMVYSTRYNAEAVPLYGIAPITANVTTGDFTVIVDDLYIPIIPTSTTETALADVNPGGDSPALIAGNTTTVSFTTTLAAIKPDVMLYCGTGITPGSLSIAVSGATITDSNGIALLAAAAIGTVDYSNGLVRWNAACPNYGTAAKTVTFTPASRPIDIAETASQRVTAENRGYVWVITLTPIPAPGTVHVSYRVNNQWYVLEDAGGGLLAGPDSSYGSGTVSFTTGTVTITTGALPDVNSDILYAWGTPAVYTARGGAPVNAPRIGGTTAHPNVTPGTVSIAWATYTLTDSASDGYLVGAGGEGAMDYQTGEWMIIPTLLPAMGTEFTVDYHYGALAVEEVFEEPVVKPDGTIDLALLNTNLIPGSVRLEWTAISAAYSEAVVEGGWEVETGIES